MTNFTSQNTFIHISTSGEKYNYIVFDKIKPLKLVVSNYPEKLTTGFYDISLSTEPTTEVNLTAADKVTITGSITKSNSFVFKDFADGIDLTKKEGSFELCGLLLEKNRPWIGNNKKRIYKVLTLAKVIVNIEVWFKDSIVKRPKLFDCIIIKNCYLDYKAGCRFVRTKASQGIQWSTCANSKRMKKVFKSLISYGEITEISSDNDYFYEEYKTFDFMKAEFDEGGWNDWLTRNAYSRIPPSKENRLLKIMGIPKVCHYKLTVFEYSCLYCKKFFDDFELENHEKECSKKVEYTDSRDFIVDSQGKQLPAISAERVKLKRVVLSVADEDTEKIYEIYVQDPSIIALSHIESSSSINKQLKRCAEEFFPKEFICRYYEGRLVLLTIC